MLLDARTVPHAADLRTEIFIVGASPAALSLAAELDGSGMAVCVLAGGGLAPDPRAQLLYATEMTGDAYLSGTPMATRSGAPS